MRLGGTILQHYNTTTIVNNNNTVPVQYYITTSPPPNPRARAHLLVQLQEHLGGALLELVHHVLLLALERVAHGQVGRALPAVQAVDLRRDGKHSNVREQWPFLVALYVSLSHLASSSSRTAGRSTAKRSTVGSQG